MSRRKKPVVCLTTGKRYDSIKKAAEALGVSAPAISRAAHTGSRCIGMHFYFADKPKPPAHFFKNQDAKELEARRNRQRVPVICVETGEVFASISDAAKTKGVHEGLLSVAISGKVGGLHWKKAK